MITAYGGRDIIRWAQNHSSFLPGTFPYCGTGNGIQSEHSRLVELQRETVPEGKL